MLLTRSQEADAQTPSVAYIQGNYAVPQQSPTIVTVPFTAAQTVGDLNVVFVSWSDTTAQVSSIVDSSRNTYRLAVGPTAIAGARTQSVYYAVPIAAAAAGTNVLTVTFTVGARTPDIRVAEYRGIDPVNPVNVVAAGTGTGTNSSTPSVTTTAPAAMLVAGNSVKTRTTGSGSNFTSRLLTSPNGDILEDRLVTTAGAYNATAPLNGSGAWIMQMVAFRAAGGSGGGDIQPPTAPGNLQAMAATANQINLSWTASSDNVGVTGYQLESCSGVGCSAFAPVTTTTNTTFPHTGLAPSTSYSHRVRATDAANNLSAFSNVATVVTPAAPDIQAPTAPGGLAAAPASSTEIDLSWTPSTDNVGVTNYLIERCQDSGCSVFTQVGQSSTATFSNTGLPADTSFSYRVRATDAANNLSDYSNTASTATLSPDTQPPTAPASLMATAASGSQINLSWSASTDNVGVANYQIERCQGAGCTGFSSVGTSTVTTFTNSGLTASTSYSYRVRAMDAAANPSGYSNTATATTAASTTPPAFVQGNYAVPSSSPSVVTVPFTAAQTAGNLNVVFVSWSDTTAQVSSVADSKGNAYVLAVGPTALAGQRSQSVYYAAPIATAAAGANTVTVTFNVGALTPDIRILEYRGIDPVNPVDITSAGTGTNATSATPAVVTSASPGMLVAGNSVKTLTSGPGTNFTRRLLTSPNGDIAEDRLVTTAGSYSATAPLTQAGAWVMQMVAFRGAGSGGPDTQPPTAPSSLAAVSSLTTQVNLSWIAATDNVIVASYLVESCQGAGCANFAQVGVAPTTSFTHSGLTGGTAYSYRVRAADAPGNLGPYSNIASVTTATAPLGEWSGTISTPIVAVHAALMRNGKVLMWDGQSFGLDAYVWDPATNTSVSVPAPVNIFCSAIEQMADGRIFIGGGHVTAHVGLPAANAFNPTTQTWSVLPAMSTARWYPTATTLPDGRILVNSGESNCDGCYVAIPEIYDPGSNSWNGLSSAPFSFPYYPHVFVMPNGQVMVSSTLEGPIVSQVLDVSALTWTPIGGSALEGGSAVMYLPGQFLKAGRGVNANLATRPSYATAYVLDSTQPSATWRAVGSMTYPRTYHTLTELPDGTVLVTGGSSNTAPTTLSNGILQAELWSPVSEAWTTLASMHVPRLYHSVALLLPDGRVMVTGGGRFNDTTESTDQFSAEYFSPPYLSRGPRPVITSAPSQLTRGQSFSIQTPDASRIASVALVRLGAVTHQINMGQRYLPLSFTAGVGTLTATAPATANVAPPGYYMLFILDTNGVPSIAAIVKL